ncbi:hypothetical protein D9V29_11815 [Mycetocola manganoxydans]|uniref:Uncharacterized protein n=1 Tax=Mycetocola manganoxydans TaxID=699879 RepID=A0A3L6ZPC8_9MICO|nr:hypothetical protein [Mycetocola manganoxydans]RLP69401.1 hypothetical protein D9V29_11815 [Mycetocola manganoxydans]GHD50698.1 hypothetical protein GCM10008097_24930 [Mycetocola manganoxydans]
MNMLPSAPDSAALFEGAVAGQLLTDEPAGPGNVLVEISIEVHGGHVILSRENTDQWKVVPVLRGDAELDVAEAFELCEQLRAAGERAQALNVLEGSQ